MPRRLHHLGGALAIYDSETPAALTDPANNLGAVYFHGDLDYLKIVYDQTVLINFPARGSGSSTATIDQLYDVFPAHNLGYRPRGVLRIDNTQYPTCGILTYAGGDKYRCIRCEIDETKVYVRELGIIDGTIAADPRSVRVILYDVAPITVTDKLFHFMPASSRLIAGKGKFDTDNRYLREDRTAAPDFWMTHGRTIDASGRNFRQVLPNGQMVEFPTTGYGGSFTGTGFFGVAD